MAVEHPVAQLVAARKGPNVLHRVQLEAVRRQAQQGDVVWHAQQAAGLVSADAVDDKHSMGAGADRGADFEQVQVDGTGVGMG